MCRHFLRTIMLVTALLIAVPQALAAPLPGHIFFAFHSRTADFAAFFVFDATGRYCGTAYITTVSGAQPAFDVNMEVTYSQDVGAPNHFGVWYNNQAMPPGGACTAPTLGELDSYYISTF